MDKLDPHLRGETQQMGNWNAAFKQIGSQNFGGSADHVEADYRKHKTGRADSPHCSSCVVKGKLCGTIGHKKTNLRVGFHREDLLSPDQINNNY